MRPTGTDQFAEIELRRRLPHDARSAAAQSQFLPKDGALPVESRRHRPARRVLESRRHRSARRVLDGKGLGHRRCCRRHIAELLQACHGGFLGGPAVNDLAELLRRLLHDALGAAA